MHRRHDVDAGRQLGIADEREQLTRGIARMDGRVGHGRRRIVARQRLVGHDLETALELDPSGTCDAASAFRSEEHTSELQSLMRTSYAVFCLKKKKKNTNSINHTVRDQYY